MNPLKKGPELKLPDKMPQLKAPKFLADIYADLRDRHLLPLVAVLAVAIVAIPIVLSESGGGEDEASVTETATAEPPNAGSDKSGIVVARSTPGLRKYERRLQNLSPTNPFKPRYTGAPKEEGGGEEEAESSPESGGSSSSESTGSGEGGQSQTTHTLFYFGYEIDVRVTPVSSNGKPSEADPTVRRGLPELTPLPGKKTPALVFMQVSANEEQALMLVNPNVIGLFGEAVCVSGGETCQLLALKKGLPETVVYGGKERVFRIELLDIHVVKRAPPKESPGQPKNAG